MKKLFPALLILLSVVSYSQIINFPDANFKAALLEASIIYEIALNNNGDVVTIDLNGNGEIEVSEAQNIVSLYLDEIGIVNMQGIEYFTNLRHLSCRSNMITSLDLTSLSQLITLHCNANDLTNLNISGLSTLESVSCNYNQLSSLDLTGTTALLYLDAANNSFVNLDLTASISLLLIDISANPLQTLNIAGLPILETLVCRSTNLTDLNLTGLPSLLHLYVEYNVFSYLNCMDLTNMSTLLCSNNPNLTTLFLKNGKSQEQIGFGYCPQLRYICADPSDMSLLEYALTTWPYACEVNSYCTFTPGGAYYTINGATRIDANSNGCEANDPVIPFQQFLITDGTQSEVISANHIGDYEINVGQGTHNISPILENPDYYIVSPASVALSFPIVASPFNQNFCITPNGLHNDLVISVIPVSIARPGFDATYKIIYKNKGTQTQSGTISYAFDDAVLDFVNANPTFSSQDINYLNWYFTDLHPFESREITVILNANSPSEVPPVNGGDILNFTASVNSSLTDESPNDNTFVINQTVVNSFDPNDKTCLEGNTITPEMVGKEVHYMIRFENTGTANAENVVVKDMIDTAKFDINSLIPIDGSHPFITKISNTNKVEFIFENINLPFDDANNDGYVAFKIKTKPSLVLGNTFSNTASIYFDYNFPIVTNTATTTIALLANQDFAFENYFKIYPNPTKDILNIEMKKTIAVTSINIYNTLGQLVLVIPNAQQTKSVDVSSLKTGNYFLKINSDKGSSNVKFVKI